ncbi:MAG: hypothetical protein U1E56_02275 [Bauldia sp.]
MASARVVLAFLLTLAAAPAGLSADCNDTPARPDPSIRRCLIEPEMYAEFAREFDERVNLVVIDSAGGYVDKAVKIASAIKARNLDVVFHGRCYSACANYVFLAANVRTLIDDVEVAWHGSLDLIHRCDPEYRRPSLIQEPVSAYMDDHRALLDSFGSERRRLLSRLASDPPALRPQPRET